MDARDAFPEQYCLFLYRVESKPKYRNRHRVLRDLYGFNAMLLFQIATVASKMRVLKSFAVKLKVTRAWYAQTSFAAKGLKHELS